MTDDRPRRESGLVARTAEGLLFDTNTGKLHALNPPAMAIWEACDGDTTVDEIVAAVAELSGSPLDEIAVQVETTVAALRERGLLKG